MQVSVVDYTDPRAPELFTESLRRTGFGVITNHPLPWELVTDIYAEWSELFTSGAAAEYVVDEAGQEGYFPPDVSETAKGNRIRDLKEFFHVYPWSERYPTEVSDAALRYRDIATAMAATLLGWVHANTPDDVAKGFSQPLASMIDNSTRTLLRVLHYPPLGDDAPEGAIRAAAHEDINLLTVLPASDEPGLELLGTNGSWYPVPCDPGSIAVNSGEMLDLASDGYFPATTHRVVNPIGEAARRARMSLPLFLHPADDVIIADGRTAESLLLQRIEELRGRSKS